MERCTVAPVTFRGWRDVQQRFISVHIQEHGARGGSRLYIVRVRLYPPVRPPGAAGRLISIAIMVADSRREGRGITRLRVCVSVCLRVSRNLGRFLLIGY